jgi:hypothetical protein
MQTNENYFNVSRGFLFALRYSRRTAPCSSSMYIDFTYLTRPRLGMFVTVWDCCLHEVQVQPPKPSLA